MNIKNWKVSTRLAAGFGFVLVLLMMVAGIGYWRLEAVGVLISRMLNETLVKERLITEWYSLTHVNGARTLALASATGDRERQRNEQRIATASARVSEIQQRLEGMLHGDDEAALYAAIGERRDAYRAARQEVIAQRDKGDGESVAALTESRLEPAMNAYLDSIDQLARRQVAEIDALSREAAGQNRSSQILLICLSVLALLAGTVFAIWTARSIILPIRRAVDIARQVAGGDLSADIEVSTTDETGQMQRALKDMNDGLASIVDQVRQGTDAIASASSQIAAGSQDLAARTEEQAGSLEETAASMGDLVTAVQRNADNSRQANQLARAATDIAGTGGAVMSEVVDIMDSINGSSRKVVDIISVIDGIAFQTNILALNAAVEAARAGEQGRGFAVVASEVRNLAQRSAAAAKEIKTLIGNSVEQVDAGSRLVQQAGVTMEHIVAGIQQVTDLMGEITAASQEQSDGIAQVNQAMTSMDRVTQQNASLVEEAAAAVGSLHQQTDQLSRAVGVFRLAGELRKAAVAAALPVRALPALKLVA